MLESSVKTQPASKGGDFPLIPEDVYHVVIEDINEVTVPAFNNPSETETKFNFQFLILEDGDFKGQRLFKRVSPTVFSGSGNNRPSYLYQIWKAATKSEPTAQQLELGLSGDELNSLISKQLRVSVKVSAPNAKGKQYSNVEGVMHAKSELPLPKLKSKAPSKPATQAAHEEESVFDEPKEQVNPDDLPF